MAQLIKLQDYISRYEKDFYRYPGQFLRMKKESWSALLHKWEEQQSIQNELPSPEKEEKRFGFNFFKKKKEVESFLVEDGEDKETIFAKDEEELKKYFLDYLYPFQIKWASSTIYETSMIDNTYYHDPLLKYFLYRYPDTFFVMFYPIFKLKNAVVDGDIIVITPIEVLCIAMVEKSENVSIIAEEGRTWFLQEGDIKTKTLSPMIGLKRTENIVKSILNKYEIAMPTRKVVLSRTNNIIFGSEPYRTSYIGKDSYSNWFQQMRKLSSPLKHDQLKVGEALLNHCLTTAIRRAEWEQDEEEDSYNPFQ